MSCKKDNWNKIATIAGGIAIGACGIGLVIAAPLEIGLTVAVVGATKLALDKTTCEDEEHTHE